MSYTPRYPDYGKKIDKGSLNSLSLTEYLARGINGEAGFSDQKNDKKAVAKIFYNRKHSNKSEFGDDYKTIAYKALDCLKHPNSKVLDPRSNDIESKSFDEAIDAAKALVEGNFSYINITKIKDFCFFVDDSLLKDFKVEKIYEPGDPDPHFVYFFRDKLLREKYVYLDRLIFFTYEGY